VVEVKSNPKSSPSKVNLKDRLIEIL